MSKKSTVASAGILSIFVAALMVAGYFGYQLLKNPMSHNKSEIIFEVPPGTALSEIADELQAKSLIRNSKSFQWYARAKGLAAKIKVGEYSLNQSMNPDEIMNILVSGKSIARSITIAEGLNLYDIAQLFVKFNICSEKEFYEIVYDRAFIKSLLKEDLPSLEGYLYPETYKFTRYEGPRAIITQMVKGFLTVWDNEIAPVAKLSGWKRNQIVIFSSIVEKETGAGFERPLVASVFHNRLLKKMRLQTDPTVLYGMAVKLNKMPDNITRNDLITPTPYNTYTNFGLPPTPISNPGKEALLATLKPASTKYLYFVSQNNGTHIFSETLQQHNKAVQDFQVNRKAREGKSWKDLKQAGK